MSLRNTFCSIFWAGLASAELLKLDFTKTAVSRLDKRQNELELPLYNDIFHQRYLVNLTIGTPPQLFSLTVDTASADLWVPTANSSGCQPSCPPPTFDPKDSSTARFIDRPFNASYGLTPDLQVLGDYFNDTVGLGNAVIPNMTGTHHGNAHFQELPWNLHHANNLVSSTSFNDFLALCNVPKPIFDAGIYGLFGLGSRYGESIYQSSSSPYYQDPNATFPTIYEQLELQGYTSRRLFSLWLNDLAAATGSILFGGIDTTKYQGKLCSVPVLLGPDKKFTGWAVNLTSVMYIDGSNGTQGLLPAKSSGIRTVLDSGSPNNYLPTAIADAVGTRLNASMQQGFPYVACSLHKDQSQFIEFGFGSKSSGPRIKVPIPEMIYPFGAPANIGNVTAADGTKLCYLGLIGTDGFVHLLGDTFIRSAYIVYDVDNLQVSMAPAVYGAELEEQLVEL